MQAPSVFNGFAKYDWKKTMPEGSGTLLDMYKGWSSLVNGWPEYMNLKLISKSLGAPKANLVK